MQSLGAINTAEDQKPNSSTCHGQGVAPIPNETKILSSNDPFITELIAADVAHRTEDKAAAKNIC